MKSVSQFNSNIPDQFITLHNQEFLNNQRIAGKIAAQCFDILENLLIEKTNLTYLEMNNMIEDFIIQNKCTPTFKNYKGFPTALIVSVNKQLVHGIPTNEHPNEGDLISFDLGITYKGAIADTASTFIYGQAKSQEHQRLISSTKEALNKAIKAIQVGKRIGVIGETIYKYGKSQGFSVVENYGGHGIKLNTPHCDPFVSNRSTFEEGVHIQPNMSIAIEPLFVIGNSNKTHIDKDNWTVVAENICAHFEKTIYIHQDSVEIITLRDKDK